MVFSVFISFQCSILFKELLLFHFFKGQGIFLFSGIAAKKGSFVVVVVVVVFFCEGGGAK